MQVLYVDVYFLINFTVDAIALFMSAKLLHIRTAVWRILIIALLGAALAVCDAVFIADTWLAAVCAVLFFLCVVIIISSRLSPIRRIKTLVVFLCFEMLLGGAVSCAYRLLDGYMGDIEEYFASSNVNKKALVFSVIILLAIGVLKLFIMLFSEQTRIKSTKIKIKLGSFTAECDALVDSGNLVKDPMNMNPVLFIKMSVAERFLPREILELSELDRLDPVFRKRIRLIPVTRGGSTHVLTGVLPDEVRCEARNFEALSLTLAIDKEEGSYGGHEALLPASVLES